MTRRERLFAKAYAETGDAMYAGSKASYGVTSGAASKALARPAVQEAIEAFRAKLIERLLPLAEKRLVRILEKSKSDTAAVSAIDKVFKAVSLYAPRSDGNDQRELHEMSHAELLRVAYGGLDQTLTDLEPEPAVNPLHEGLFG